jgi:hypothetical protein
MGRKPINRVRCPRCKKIGTLRIKGRHSVIVSHYDKEKARSGRGKGMRSHYIGSLRFDIDKILRPFEGQMPDIYFSYFKVALARLKKNYNPPKKENKLVNDGDASIFLIFLDQLRKIKDHQRIETKLHDRRLHWYARCKSCHQPYHLYATFRGVPDYEGVRVYSTREPEADGRKYDVPLPYKRRYYGLYRRRRYG